MIYCIQSLDRVKGTKLTGVMDARLQTVKITVQSYSLIVLHNLRGGDKNISYDIHTAAAMQMAFTYLASRPPNF